MSEKTCPNCGTRVPDGQRICPRCGTSVALPEGPEVDARVESLSRDAAERPEPVPKPPPPPIPVPTPEPEPELEPVP